MSGRNHVPFYEMFSCCRETELNNILEKSFVVSATVDKSKTVMQVSLLLPDPVAPVDIALIEEGTFEAAARRLSVTPSAISQRIKAMEKATGQLLVQRTNPVETTAAGDIALRYGRQMRLLGEEAARALAQTLSDQILFQLP